MPTLTRPGVYVQQSNFPAFVSSSPGTATACFVGWNPRGPIVPRIVNSWREYVGLYGGFEPAYAPSPLSLAVFSYFSAGGSSAVIIRAVNTGSGTAPLTASLALPDQSPAPGISTLLVSAANPGLWGINLQVDVVLGTLKDPVTNNVISFTLQVKYLGSDSSHIVERWENLSMVKGSTAQGHANYAPDVINSAFNGSMWIKVTDLNSATASPADNPQVTAATTPLVGGSDGSLPMTPNDYNLALSQLDQFPDQPFIINLPGITDGSTVSQAISYAQGRGDGFVILDCPPGMPPGSPTAGGMVGYMSTVGASSQAAMYYPQVIVADPYSPVPGRTRLIPPGGFVAGLYVSTDASRGVQKAPAGLGATLTGAYGVETVLTNQNQSDLTQANVNCIISVPNQGVVVWGARTLSPYLVTRYVPVQRTLIYLQTEFVAMTRFAVFEPNDYVLWNQIGSILTQFLDSFWQSGGLRGNSAAAAYYVICDDSNNTLSSIQQGIVNVEVGVALESPAEFIVINIGQWAGGASATITTI
jgi:phage tail sheath protein FI